MGSQQTFDAAYDALLARWPEGTTTADVAGEFGTTRVTSVGQGPPLVLLPGSGPTSLVWFEVATALAPTHRVHAVDIIGDVGRSVGGARRPRSPDDLTAWLTGVLEDIADGPIDIVAHSYGAMIALGCALAHSDRVRKLILLDPNSTFTRMNARYLLRALPLLLAPSARTQERFLRWETGSAPLDPGWVDLLLAGADLPRTRTVVPKRPAARALADLSCDLTVVAAGRGKVHDAGDLVTVVRATAPTAEVVVLEGATHHTLPLHPSREVCELLERVLSRQPRQHGGPRPRP